MESNGRRIKLCEFGKRGLFSLPGVFSPTDQRGLFTLPDVFFIPADVLSPRTFCPAGRSVAGRFVPPDVLSLRTFCPPRHFVPLDVFSAGLFVPLDVFSHGRLATRRFVAGRFVAGRFVWAPAQQFLKPKPEQLFHQIV
jgi:hypothetical protein